ncbi:hypothetical protein FRC03_008083 [Tulasnella sp. 419]|nr:hypothetical protein FRC03_008083 [Tulasnella sp. 419]
MRIRLYAENESFSLSANRCSRAIHLSHNSDLSEEQQGMYEHHLAVLRGKASNLLEVKFDSWHQEIRAMDIEKIIGGQPRATSSKSYSDIDMAPAQIPTSKAWPDKLGLLGAPLKV